MLESIVMVEGNIIYPITLDPGVWIFDDRKVDLESYFQEEKVDPEDTYTKDVSQHWDRERTEGARSPSSTNDNKIKYDKQELFTKSYGIPLYPFLENATPHGDATTIELHTSSGDKTAISLKEAKDGILGFSLNGKPLTDGPVHFYYGDGSNEFNPLKKITRIVVK